MFRRAGWVIVAGLVPAACGSAGDDPNIARVCNVLTEVAAQDTDPKVEPDMVQMHVVMGLANAFGDDMEYLGSLPGQIDKMAEASCPHARTAIVALSGKETLAAIIR
jgi:hypothetical protein